MLGASFSAFIINPFIFHFSVLFNTLYLRAFIVSKKFEARVRAIRFIVVQFVTFRFQFYWTLSRSCEARDRARARAMLTNEREKNLMHGIYHLSLPTETHIETKNNTKIIKIYDGDWYRSWTYFSQSQSCISVVFTSGHRMGFCFCFFIIFLSLLSYSFFCLLCRLLIGSNIWLRLLRRLHHCASVRIKWFRCEILFKW